MGYMPPPEFKDQCRELEGTSTEGVANKRQLRQQRLVESGATERIQAGIATREDLDRAVGHLWHDSLERGYNVGIAVVEQDRRAGSEKLATAILAEKRVIQSRIAKILVEVHREHQYLFTLEGNERKHKGPRRERTAAQLAPRVANDVRIWKKRQELDPRPLKETLRETLGTIPSELTNKIMGYVEGSVPDAA